MYKIENYKEKIGLLIDFLRYDETLKKRKHYNGKVRFEAVGNVLYVTAFQSQYGREDSYSTFTVELLLPKALECPVMYISANELENIFESSNFECSIENLGESCSLLLYADCVKLRKMYDALADKYILGLKQGTQRFAVFSQQHIKQLLSDAVETTDFSNLETERESYNGALRNVVFDSVETEEWYVGNVVNCDKHTLHSSNQFSTDCAGRGYLSFIEAQHYLHNSKKIKYYDITVLHIREDNGTVITHFVTPIGTYCNVFAGSYPDYKSVIPKLDNANNMFSISTQAFKGFVNEFLQHKKAFDKVEKEKEKWSRSTYKVFAAITVTNGELEFVVENPDNATEYKASISILDSSFTNARDLSTNEKFVFGINYNYLMQALNVCTEDTFRVIQDSDRSSNYKGLITGYSEINCKPDFTKQFTLVMPCVVPITVETV